MGRNPARAPLDLLLGLVAMLAGVATGSAVSAQPASLADLVSAVVQVKNRDRGRPQDCRYVDPSEREGSGFVIGDEGLVLTIGYMWSPERPRSAPTTAAPFPQRRSNQSRQTPPRPRR